MGDKSRFSSSNNSGPRNRGSTGKSGATRNRSSSPELSETIPIIPHIKLHENTHTLPTYSTALSRPPQESIPSEDLDAIQLELEMLLSTVALRHRVLKSELDTIDKGDHKSSSSSASRPTTTTNIEKPPISPGKRRRTDDNTTQPQSQQQQLQQQQYEKRAKLRDSSGKVANSNRLGKLKNSLASSPVPSQHTDDSSDAHSYTQHNSSRSKNQNAKLVHRNDTPNKFWLSIEPYCMPITQEDLRMLDDLIEEFSGNITPNIPELGPHYGIQFGLDDLNDEKDSSNAQVKGGGGSIGKKGASQTHNSTQNGEVMRILRNSKKVMGDGVTGPLTQRLVSALMEENLINDSTNTTTTTSTENSNSSLENQIPNNGVMQTRSTVGMLKNGISIERRVRKELVEQGILDDEDLTPTAHDDEILQEIERVHTELSGIARFNTSELLKLQSIANEEMKRLEIKRKLDDVDQRILETHEKVVLAKQKGRKLTKQERDDIIRLTDEQKELARKLDLIKIPGFTVELS